MGVINNMLEDKMILRSFINVSQFSNINLTITTMYGSHIYGLCSVLRFTFITLNCPNKAKWKAMLFAFYRQKVSQSLFAETFSLCGKE